MYSSHWCVQHECYHHMDFTKLDSIAECTRNLAQRKVRQKNEKKHQSTILIVRECAHGRLSMWEIEVSLRARYNSISPSEHWCFAAMLLPIRLFYFVLFFCVSFFLFGRIDALHFICLLPFLHSKKTKTKTNDKKNSIECERHALHSSSTVKYFRCVFVFHK